MKKFETIEEYRAYADAYDAEKGISPWDSLFIDEAKDSVEFTARLIADGYDPSDLLADGHAYGCAPYPNRSGWMYRDEIDRDMMANYKGEIRDR